MSAARVIAILNQKGGTGKTTTAVNLGAGLSRQGRRVLLIDMDPLGGLTFSMGLDPWQAKPTIYEVIMGRAGLADATLRHEYPGGGYDFIPANLNLEGAEIELIEVRGRELQLRKSISKARTKYDYIIIDAAPRLSILGMNGLYAASEVFLPLDSQYLGMNGLMLLLDSVKMANQELGHDLKVSGVILTKYADRYGLAREISAIIEEKFKRELFRTRIRNNVALAEAPSWGKDIFDYKPTSNGAKDYAALTLEVIGQEGRQRSE